MVVKHIFEKGKRIKPKRTMDAEKKATQFRGAPLNRRITGEKDFTPGLTGEEINKKLEDKKAVNKILETKRIAALAEEQGNLANVDRLGNLRDRQAEELRKVAALEDTSKPLGLRERQAAAGLATANVLGSMVPGVGDLNAVDPNQQVKELNPLAKIGFQILGATSMVNKWIAPSLYAPNAGLIKNLQDEATGAVQQSRQINIDVTKGANLDEAIDRNIMLEENIRGKYDSAILALRQSPGDIIEGLEITDDLVRALDKVTRNRQVLERYQITRDKGELLLNAQQEILGEQAQ